MVRRVVCTLLALVILLGLIPVSVLEVHAASNIVMNGVDIGYSDGSYFTKNGNSCRNSSFANGRCHKNGICDSTTSSQCNCMRYWPTGNPSNCQVDLLGSQCLAFARYCQWKVYGFFATGTSSSYSNVTGTLGTSACTAATLKSKLLNCAPATHVRMPSPHSISIISTSDSGVTFADCNSDGYCKVRVFTYNWSDFATYVQGKGGITYAYSRNGVNPTPVDCACSTVYAGQYVCTTTSMNLTIRNGHGATYSAIGAIPPGATVTVTKASGTGTSDWAHVTYNGVSGYASMEYLKKPGPTHAETPTIRWWLSDSEYGENVTSLKAGNRYYFCYRLYDSVTGKNWDEIENASYTVRLTFYNPDGSVKHTNSNTFDYDQSWISSFFGEAGTYKMGVVLDGDYVFSGERSFTVEENPIVVDSSLYAVYLVLGGTESETIYVGYSGYYDGNWVLNYSCSNSNVSCSWGEWTDDHRSPLTITANAMGTTTVTISAKDKDTGLVLDSTEVIVGVGAKSYAVSYNANGGVGAPGSQTKYHNTTLTLSSTKPTRTGYTFLGWSTSSTASSATYQPSGSFTINADTTLYAVWKKNPTALSVDSSNSAVISAGDEMKYFTYTPGTSGKYVIYSTASEDTRVYLYNANGSVLDSDDDDGDGTNFRLEYNLTAGTTYTFGVKYYDSSKTGTIPFKFGRVYTITYNANGGTGAPDPQSKDYGQNATLSTSEPRRTGYTFLGWSTSSTATSATYQQGQEFTNNADTTLYAVWKLGCAGGAHSYDYRVNREPTISASGTLQGICNKCNGSTTVTLPRLNTTDYTYSVTKAATCTASGTGRYTWKTTTYGNFGFDVTIPVIGHSYSYKVTKAPTVSANGTLEGSCSNCSGITTLTLPKLDKTNYSYTVVKKPTATATGTGRYTWKNTNYGTFYFDVTLDKEELLPGTLEIVSYPHKTVYHIGESFDQTGLCLQVIYGDPDQDEVICESIEEGYIYEITGFDSATVGTKTLTVHYEGMTVSFTVTVVAEEEPDAPQLIVSSECGAVGSTVTVTVDMKNNPGFSGMNAYLTYADGLELIEVTNSTSLTFTNDVTMVWDGVSDYTDDGQLLKLVFRISDSAEPGEYFVKFHFLEAYTMELEDVTFATVDGGITVTDCVYGDADGDGVVNTKDIILIRRYVAAKDPETGVSAVQVEAGADSNGDGAINTKDIILVRQYVAAKDPTTGESSVVLGPKTK